MHQPTPSDIRRTLSVSGIHSEYTHMSRIGEGEVNNSYLIETASDKFVLRVAKSRSNTTLKQEAFTLPKLPQGIGPGFTHYDESCSVLDRPWLLETYVPGTTPRAMTTDLLSQLGTKLAKVHAIRSKVDETGLAPQQNSQLWPALVRASKSFYTEDQLLNDVPDRSMLKLIEKGRQFFLDQQHLLDIVDELSLIHGDLTPSNMLVVDTEIYLIDWEFSGFNDPMREFSTFFYDDIDYNRGRWRPLLSSQEKQSLFSAYEAAGGMLDHERINVWIQFDKLGAAIFLMYRLYSDAETRISKERRAQYQYDYEQIKRSLAQKF